MRIRNHEALAVTPARSAALAIAESALAAIDTGAAIRRAVSLDGDRLRVGDEKFVLADDGRLRLVAVGKCATTAAASLLEVAGERLGDGIVLDVAAPAGVRLPPRLAVHSGTHPLPSAANVASTRSIVQFLEDGRPGDIVLFVVSGGASTLLCLPPGAGSCEAERAVVEALTREGATIAEINTVRKHCSLARGGRLSAVARPALVLALLFVDVPGGSLDLVASGPTVLDPSTVADAQAVLGRYGLATDGAPAPLRLVETPKDPALFAASRNLVVVSNRTALDAMATAAAHAHRAAAVRTATLAGEAREVAAGIVAELRAAKRGAALLYGGETTDTVRGPGRGGRNLELALAALPAVADDELVLTLASDGRDNGYLAGAIADAVTAREAQRRDVDPATFLRANDSYGFFECVPHALDTGHTGANVADLVVALKG